MEVHPIPPVYDAHSRILILGSFPSVASREECFFYAHKQNRFWKVLASVYGRDVPGNTEEKKELLLSTGTALWDVIRSCDITGSSDASIRNVTANDISGILSASPIEKIFTNGKKAHSLYVKYILPQTGREDICLPSTSAANAARSLDSLTEEWKELLE